MTTTSRADFLAVHSIDEFVFAVPELEAARHFYTSFGLDVRDDDGGALALHTHCHPHRWARVLPGRSKRLLWLSLGIHAGDAKRFERHLAEREIPRIDPPAGADRGGLWIAGPDGLPIQLRVAEKCSPSQPSPREFSAEHGNAGRAPSRGRTRRFARCISRTSSCSAPTWRRRGSFTKTCSACASRTIPAPSYPFCTARTAATTT